MGLAKRVWDKNPGSEGLGLWSRKPGPEGLLRGYRRKYGWTDGQISPAFYRTSLLWVRCPKMKRERIEWERP